MRETEMLYVLNTVLLKCKSLFLIMNTCTHGVGEESWLILGERGVEMVFFPNPTSMNNQTLKIIIIQSGWNNSHNIIELLKKCWQMRYFNARMHGVPISLDTKEILTDEIQTHNWYTRMHDIRMPLDTGPMQTICLSITRDCM